MSFSAFTAELSVLVIPYIFVKSRGPFTQIIQGGFTVIGAIANCPGVSEVFLKSQNYAMTSSNDNIFRVTGPLCGEFTGHR